MAGKSRSLNFILLVCALIGAAWFFGCSGGTASDPIVVPVLQISGTVYSQDNLGNIRYDGNLQPDMRAQFAAPGVLVHLASDETKNATTDKDGKYVITGLQPGTYQVVARIKVSDTLAYKAISTTVTVSDQKATVEAPQLDLKKATARVYGVVKKADGSNFPNAKLTLWGESFYSESDGTFKSPLMVEGLTDKIVIDQPGYQQVELPVTFVPTAPYINQTIVTTSATNRAPTTTLAATRYAVDKLYEVNLTGTANDVDSNIATYTWAKTAGEFTSDQTNPLLRTWFAPNTDTIATITFTAIDSAGLKSASSVMIKVGKGIVVPNNPPTVDNIALSPIDISGARYYRLSVVATDTIDKDLLTYSWSLSSTTGKTGTLQTNNTASVTWISPDVTTTTDVTIKVIVDDRKENGKVEKTVTLSVAPTKVNQTPQIAGIQISSTPIYGYTEYLLTVSASDPDNDPITYLWNASGTIIDSAKSQTVWKTPVVLATETREVSVRVTDIKGASSIYKVTYEINPTDIVPPTVTILTPHENDLILAGQSVSFTGKAIASGNVEINEARFTWYEQPLNGQFTTLKAGQSIFGKTYNTPGTYTVKLEAYDSLFVTGEDTVTFRINATPTVSITAPPEKSIAQLGSTVSFSATGADVEDVTIASDKLYWTFPAPVGNQIGTTFNTNQLPAGTHTVQVYSADSLTATSSTAARQIFINPPPTITDIQPASGTVFMQGANVAFSTTVTDTEGAMVAGNINWYVGATAIGSGFAFTKNDLSTGWNTITLKASDTLGGQISTSTMIFINTAPTMVIDLPLDRSSVGLNQSFKMKGRGTDTAGIIDTALFIWEDYGFNRDATSTISVVGVTPDEFDFAGYTSTADFGSHTITLTGFDKNGAPGKKSVEIFVNSTPQVTITSPASGTRNDTDTGLTFTATVKEDDHTDILSVRWFDAATNTVPLYTQPGLTVDEITKEATVVFNTSNLASGPHNIFCQVTDMYGRTGVASVGVLINKLPILQSGKIAVGITDITTSYATAPENISVFLSTNPGADLRLSADDFDYELNGSINAYDPDRIKWFLNDSDLPFATGSVAVQKFPIGYNVITLRLYDTFSPQFINQASNTYQTSFYVWQSTEMPVPSGTLISMHGDGETIYLGLNSAPRCIRAYEYITGNLPVIKELKEPDNFYDLGNASVTFSLNMSNGLLNDGKIAALGKIGATDYIVHFEDPATPATHTFAGMQNATSVAFNTQDQTIGYLTNTSNQVIRFSPLTWNLVPGVFPVTEAESIPFNTLGRVRYAPITPAYGSRVCVADTGNNRVVRFLSDSLANPMPVNASSPIDMVFTQNRILTLSNADKKVSVHNISTSKTTHMMDFGTPGTGAGQFNNPIGVYLYQGDLFILEDNRLQVIRSGEDDWLK